MINESSISKKELKKALIEPDHISEENFELAQTTAENNNKKITDVLVNKGLITEKNLAFILADLFDVPLFDLSTKNVEQDVILEISDIFARSNSVAAVQSNENSVTLAMRDPSNLEVIEVIEKKFNKEVKPVFISKSDFEKVLNYYNSDFIGEIKDSIENFRNAKNPSENLVSDLVDNLLKYGYNNEASDIHLEPIGEKVLVRYRIDGVLNQLLKLPNSLYNRILYKIKILSGLKTDEHSEPQDGKLKFEVGEKKVGVRVSIAPVVSGEKTVLRLLTSDIGNLGLEDLGLQEHDLEKIKKSIESPQGMILSTGPTGSGKTTTLYSLIRKLNSKEINITTIEDPVEQDILGVNQIPVKKEVGLDFSEGLRSIVRQDPDIIMVGEIRDEETAQISVNAALTGHLVLSTLHTNNASTTIPRLLDMGVDPFLVTSTLNIAIAQRLVRKICNSCRASKQISESNIEKIKAKHIPNIEEYIGDRGLEDLTTYKGQGCSNCNQSGYEGRVGVFEVLYIDHEIKSLIKENADSNEIQKKAQERGMTLMIEDGFNKALTGVTTIEEVLRVTSI